MKSAWRLLSLVAALVPTPVRAATCDVRSVSVGFGVYDSLAAAPTDGVGRVTVVCDADVTFTLALGAGRATVADRRMTNGSRDLGYNLYTDASRSSVWGDGVSSQMVSASGRSVDLPVYGRIPARQPVPAGSYMDSLVITVSF